MGAYREHFGMSFCYAVLITLCTFGSIKYAINDSNFWFEVIIYLMVCGVAYAYIYDLNRIRQSSAPSMIISTPMLVPGQNVPGQYAASQQSNQYGKPSAPQTNWKPPPYPDSQNIYLP